MTDFSLPFVLAQDAAPTPPASPAPPAPAVEAPAAPAPPMTPGGDTTTLVPPGPDGAAAPMTGQPAGQGAGPFGGDGFMLILLLGFALMLVFMMTGQRKEKKKRAAMLSALKKGDKVTTVGGIIGNVVEVRENEVVLKVDENSNTRMRFSRAAIQSVVEEKSE